MGALNEPTLKGLCKQQCSIDPDTSVPDYKKDEIKNSPWGNITYLEYKKKIEFGVKEYDEINKSKKQNRTN